MGQKYSAKQLLKMYGKNIEHSKKVCEISLKIYKLLNESFTNYLKNEKIYLENASLLHDIGYCINNEDHHKHSCKIIEKSLDFSKKEAVIIGNIAKFHRGSLPNKSKHKSYCNLDYDDRQIVKRLGAILKLADGMENGIVGKIDNINLKVDKENKISYFEIKCENSEKFDYNIVCLNRKKDFFEKVYETQVVFKFN